MVEGEDVVAAAELVGGEPVPEVEMSAYVVKSKDLERRRPRAVFYLIHGRLVTKGRRIEIRRKVERK